MAKTDKIYFDNLSAAATYACQAADHLVTCMTGYHPDSLEQMLSSMHEIEHTGDGKKHEMAAMLAKAFVTPVDREDLALVSQNIDDVTDSIEEVLQGFYMYRIPTVMPEAVTFVQKISECCHKMAEMLEHFIEFKKPAKLHQLVVELNNLEEECDKLYIENIRHLPDHTTDVLEIISWRKLYDRMEACADACEHVGDSVDMVVMKNS